MLQILDLSNNFITSLLPLSGLAHLRSLYASNNRITSIFGLECSQSLIEIDLENNLITVSDLKTFNKNSSLCAVSILNNPIARYYLFRDLNTHQLQFCGFKEFQEGVFYRNLDRLKEAKVGKLKLLMKKSTNGELDKSQRNRANFSTKNQNMREVYDQVIDEDPEMEEYLCTSESEGIAESEECIKKPSPSIAKLQLEKITEKSPDKVSYEKWSTKPESAIESVFEDIIQYYKIEEVVDKGQESCEKYEYVLNALKQREDQRKDLIQQLRETKELLAISEENYMNLQQSAFLLERDLDEKNLEISKLIPENLKLRKEIESFREFNSEIRKEYAEYTSIFNQKELQYKERIKELDEEKKPSSRRNFSCSFDSESTYNNGETPEIAYSSIVNSEEVIVARPIGDYIQRLLQKISTLASKTKKLRVQREKYKNMFESTKKK